MSRGAPDDAAPTAAFDAAPLRWAVGALESATARRRRVEERLRAAVTGADARWPTAAPLDGPAARALLAHVRAGRTVGPVPVLGCFLRLRHLEEAEARARVAAAVALHPTWPWLSSLHGMGPVLAARLLARLDVTCAATPSAFVAHCGLAPRRATPGRGAPPAYDRRAKVACHLIARSWLRNGGAYAEYYRAQRRRRDAQRPAWPPARRHLTALRAAEQAFLAHLWVAWREALGLPALAPYAEAVLGLPPVPAPATPATAPDAPPRTGRSR